MLYGVPWIITSETSMAISTDSFDAQYAHFRDSVHQASGSPFTSFRDGLASEWEDYKPRLRQRALALLDTDGWRENSIGTGKILDCVIASIEIKDRNASNNLVRWQNRFGHANRSHHALLDARFSGHRSRDFERVLFDLYRDPADRPADAFEHLRALAGGRYDLLAYLFFLKDLERYMPIATQTFDKAFALLGIDLVTTARCSWENYTQYNQALSEVQGALRERAGLPNVRLIDAHSFCWMLVRLDAEILHGATPTRRRNPTSRDTGTIYDARKKSIWEMANTVEQTVRNANGQLVERVVKAKELRMSRLELEKLIDELMTKQENRCALTGIPFRFRGDQQDDQLLPSVDRIDSNGHYEASNVQVVCRFVNFWKGDTDNEEFLRLLELVRGDSQEHHELIENSGQKI
jgi:hypothetical protein